jgi:hypothetical protein
MITPALVPFFHDGGDHLADLVTVVRIIFAQPVGVDSSLDDL